MTRTNRTHGAKWLARILGLGQLLIAIVIAVTAGWLLVSFPVWFPDPPRLDLPMDMEISPDTGLLPLEPGSSGVRDLKMNRLVGELELKFESPWAQWIFIFLVLQEFVLILLVLMFMQKIVASIATGEAFSQANAGRLRWVGGLLILAALFGPGASTLVSQMALRGMEIGGASLTVNWFREFGQGEFISGWIVLILSEVFRQGAEMQKDQSLTI